MDQGPCGYFWEPYFYIGAATKRFSRRIRLRSLLPRSAKRVLRRQGGPGEQGALDLYNRLFDALLTEGG